MMRLLRTMSCWALASLAAMLVPTGTAHAADPVICSASVNTINFGNIDPTGSNVDISATLNWSCDSNVRRDYYATVCFNIADGPLGLNGGRRQMAGPGGNLGFQIFTNGARTNVWGSVNSTTYPSPVRRDFFIEGNSVESGTIAVYSRLYGNEPQATVGTYTTTFVAPQVRITGILHGGGGGNCTSAGSDAGNFAPMTVMATVQPMCTVNASDLDFGTVAGFLSAANHDGTSVVSVQCVNGSAYQIGLDNGQHALGNTRRMQGPGGFISYELYRNSARTQRWGNTINTDTVAGTGDGSTQNHSVHGRVPTQPTPSAGDYSDTITVTVTY